MTAQSSDQQTQRQLSLSEDWLATLVGLAIVLIIGSGLLGPGAQTISLEVEPGTTSAVGVMASVGWKVTSSQPFAAEAAPFVTLEAGRQYVYYCEDDLVYPQLSGSAASENTTSGQAEIVLENKCAEQIALTYTHDAAIRWPLLNLFTR